MTTQNTDINQQDQDTDKKIHILTDDDHNIQRTKEDHLINTDELARSNSNFIPGLHTL